MRQLCTLVPRNIPRPRFEQHLASLMDIEHMSAVEAILDDGRAIAPLLVIKGVLIQGEMV